MTSVSETMGRPAVYPLRHMNVNDTLTLPVPTGADVKRVARAVSRYGNRHDRFYRCKTDRKTRLMTVTRIR